MSEDREEAAEVAEGADDGEGEDQNGQSRTWYPYITKAQFEKFLARLQSKSPEKINRDYIRAIIRTPSMIYRFLRGIEAMKLIDRDQKPTERLQGLVNQDSRKQTLGEIVRDLYPELMESWDKDEAGMSDRDVVAFFRKETGMGNDSANKMKMFFKYLMNEADLSDAPPETSSADVAAAPEAAAPEAAAPEAAAPEAAAPEAAAPEAEAPAPVETPKRAERSAGPSRRGQQRQSSSTDGANSSDRGSNERGSSDRGSSDRGSSDRGQSSSRPLSEAQRAYLDTLKAVLRVNVDGDWDDDMIRLAFDRLERLFDRVRRG